jgi:hypothetical protein
MKNLLLILGVIATTAISAQDAVRYNIDIAPFNHLDYTFADVFFVDRDGNVNQRANRTQLLPGGQMCGMNSTALTLGSLVIVDMYNRNGEFTHSFSAYVVEDELGNVITRVVEPSPIVSLAVGGQDNYTDFLLENY